MHEYRIAHMDISMHNFLIDHEGRCACIDYELSRRFAMPSPRISGVDRGTEIPPESTGHCQRLDPYKVDVWALGILILRASKVR